jgi:hypothetical protein
MLRLTFKTFVLNINGNMFVENNMDIVEMEFKKMSEYFRDLYFA